MVYQLDWLRIDYLIHITNEIEKNSISKTIIVSPENHS